MSLPEPIEEQIHAAVEALLLACVGHTETYIEPPAAVYRVAVPSIQYLGEQRAGAVVYMISPQSDALYGGDGSTQCVDRVETSVIVTAVKEWSQGNLPWEASFLPRARYQFRMLRDLRKALQGKNVSNDATLRLTGRNLDGLDSEAWSAVQAIFSLSYDDPVP